MFSNVYAQDLLLVIWISEFQLIESEILFVKHEYPRGNEVAVILLTFWHQVFQAYLFFEVAAFDYDNLCVIHVNYAWLFKAFGHSLFKLMYSFVPSKLHDEEEMVARSVEEW